MAAVLPRALPGMAIRRRVALVALMDLADLMADLVIMVVQEVPAALALEVRAVPAGHAVRAVLRLNL